MESVEIKDTSDSVAPLEDQFDEEKVQFQVDADREKLSARRTVSVVAVTGIIFLAIIGFLYFAKVFFLPIFLASMLSLLFKPVVQWLARSKVPQQLGAALLAL